MPVISVSGWICRTHIVFIGIILLLSECPTQCVSCYLDGKCAEGGCKKGYQQNAAAVCSGGCLYLYLEQLVSSIGPARYSSNLSFTFSEIT